MFRRKSRYYRPARSNRSDLSRRGLLGAAAVVAGAGVADWFHHPHGTSSAKSSGPIRTTGVDTSGRGGGGGASGATNATPDGGGSTAASPGQTATSLPTTPPTTSGATASSTPSQGSSAAGRAPKGAKAGDVELPLFRTKVREQPAYYLDQVVADPPKRAIALTVDDGPSAEYTPKVLRILDKYQCQASFCVVGYNVEANPRLIRDIARAGHSIVNHTYTHIQPFQRQTEKRIVDEITRTQRAVEKAAKITPELFRSPGGDWSPFIFRACASYGLQPLDWDVDPDDWQLPGTKSIVRAMLKGRPNDIVLCHDGGGNRIETVRALRQVLPVWKHRGYTTVRLTVATPPAPVVSPPPTTPTTPPASASPAITPSAQASVTTSP